MDRRGRILDGVATGGISTALAIEAAKALETAAANIVELCDLLEEAC